MRADADFTEKWNPCIGEYGYTMVPNLLLENLEQLDINSTEFMILVQLESFRWKAGNLPFPSVQRLAKRCGLKTRSITRNITSLEDKELIVRNKRKGRTNKYSLDPLIEALIEIAGDAPVDTYSRQDSRWW